VFQLLKEPHFDFMKQGRVLLSISLVVMLVAVGILIFHGLNLGIEFAGGSELQLKFVDEPDVGEVRAALHDAGIISPVVTTIGRAEQHEIYIKIAEAGTDEESKDLTAQVTQALRAGSIEPGREDLNVADQEAIRTLLSAAPELSSAEADALAEAISEHRKDVAIFTSLEELSAIEGVTPEVLQHLEERTYIGPLAVRSQSYIGPAIGRELLRKAFGAILGSLIGMLVYIWIRFQLQWGFAAVLALAHDTLITLGLFSVLGKEMSLPVVAAFLTLVGYSFNDTVVVFDRIRENVRLRAARDFRSTVNLSINQTLSRTIITSGSTFFVVFALYLFGGAALNSFAFVLSVGVLVGTYSSVYIASPVLVLWKEFQQKRASGSSTSATAAPPRRAKKVRTS
jgi:preprotein translocase subunit SecF